MSPRRTWVDDRVDVLLAVFGDLGLTTPRPAAVELVRAHVASVAERMRVTEVSARPYVTDEVLKELAHEVAFSLVDESPGADVLNVPRTAEIAVETASRAITALAEAMQVRLFGSHDVDDIRAEVAPLAQAVSALGQLLGEERNGPVPCPPLLLRRIARYLELAAEQVRQGVVPADLEPEVGTQLADAFERDAQALREVVDR